MGNYSLQKYKGTATRHTCPKCGDRHSFVYYVDENNVPLHPSVGRCNHESGCGYHYTPKEYFQEHPEHRTTNDFSFDRQRAEQKKVKQQSKPTAIGYIPPHYVEKSQSERSNFFRFLFTLLTSYYGDKAKEVLKRLLEEYRLGATRDGSVIFWQIDRTGKVRTGKVMQYNPEDGHRIKGGQTSAVNWIHSILKKQRVLAEDWQLSQCLFGEHLLKTHPDKVVVLVESEKSAVIGSAIFPDYVWLATGGKSQMREEKLRVLSGRTELLQLLYIFTVRKNGFFRIVPLILEIIKKRFYQHNIATSKIVQRMYEKNSIIQRKLRIINLLLAEVVVRKLRVLS